MKDISTIPQSDRETLNGEKAVINMQTASVIAGLDKMSLEEINAEIKAARRE